jgi:hypothetical protein
MIAGQIGKLLTEKSAYVSQVKGLELAEPELVKQDCQRHQLGQLQSRLATSMLLSIGQQTLVPGRLKFHAEVVDQAKQFP